MKRFHRIGRDERGMSYVFIGLGMTAFMSASMLAIDVGMLMTARNQAQNSADAGALAGATALLYDDFDNRSASGPAVTSAINAALGNKVMGGEVSIEPENVEFPLDPEGEATRVRVTVQRTVPTLVARPAFGIHTPNIGAVATAEVSPANAMTCVKPFTIPDKWKEMQTPPWSGDDTYDAFDKWGKPLQAVQRARTGVRRCLHPGQQAGLHRVQPGAGARRASGPPRRDRQQHHRELLLLACARQAGHHWRPTISVEHRQLQHHDLPLG
jgi:Flp pilus assembly protein TadG